MIKLRLLLYFERLKFPIISLGLFKQLESAHNAFDDQMWWSACIAIIHSTLAGVRNLKERRFLLLYTIWKRGGEGFFLPKVQSFHAEGWNKDSDAKHCLFLLLDAAISLLTAGVLVRASRI